MSDNVIQASFAAGELSPNLFARVDFAKYRSGAATMRNFFVDYRSGASTRPGTEFIRPGQSGGGKIRLVRFQQSTTVTYILEFGNQYIRFISNGSSVVEPAKFINGVTTGAETFVSFTSHDFVTNQMIFISGVSGLPQINNRYFIVTGVSGSTVRLLDGLTIQSVNSTNWGSWAGGGIAQRVYTIFTPYLGDELRMLKFSQNANTLNITHPNHPPHILTLISATNWTLVPATFGATVGVPTGVSATASTAGSVGYKYTVTAVDSQNQEGQPFFPVFVLGGASDLRVAAGTNQVTWAPVPGAFAYNVYASPASYAAIGADLGGIGFIGTTQTTVFNDSNIQADFSQTPPIHEDPFNGVVPPVYPQVSSYFQQRLVYANGGGNLVQTFWMSKTGSPYNFDVSNPAQADDAVTAALVSLEVNEIKSMVPMPSGLIMFTTKGVWQVSGGAGGVATQGGPVTPASITATPQAYVGANDVPPILINYDLIFIQAKGSIVRDLSYNIYANIYTGNDISILSSHLFYGHQVVEWAYAEEPFKTIWAVREDGILLSLTLVKEQDMYGWARHDTRGNFQSVATVTEGQFDATYFVVDRPLPVSPEGSTTAMVQCIERLADRVFPFGCEDAWAVDCGAKTIQNTPNASIGIGIGHPGDIVNVTSSVAVFGINQVGWVIRAAGGIMVVTQFVSNQFVKARVVQAMTDILPDDPINRVEVQQPGTWSIDIPITKIYGLDHLEGQQVSVLADGGVVNGLTVHGGSVELPAPVTKAIIGYGFQAQLQTMYLDLGQEVNSVQGKRKKVAALTVRVKDSRGLKAGMRFNTVTPIKEQNRVTVMGLPVPLITNDERIIMDPLWDVPGQICLQMDDPLPSTILGVIPEVVIGDSQK